MQCYERQAMYLKLYATAAAQYSDLPFNPDILEEIICDFSIENFTTLAGLDKNLMDELVLVIKLRTDIGTYSDYKANYLEHDGTIKVKEASVQSRIGESDVA